jgi:hypothetical protein
VQVIDVWEPVTESDVQTPLEVYRELQEDGYDVVSFPSHSSREGAGLISGLREVQGLLSFQVYRLEDAEVNNTVTAASVCRCCCTQDYTRVPITDEKAPKDSDFELLIRRLWDVPLNAALVFNCQMGRGRTTTGVFCVCRNTAMCAGGRGVQCMACVECL